MTLPLNGMTVLDLSRLLPGPVCSLHLQDMGARVIKIEDTGAGDYIRTLGMPAGMISPVFHILNRGKESVSLDLTAADGHNLLLKLVAQADIVLESFRPGVMKKLGLDYAHLREINPGLVMCSITGFGQTGPWAQKAGHDMNYCAISGVLEQMGNAGEAPALGNFQIADLAGGALSAAMSILAAVIGSLRHGEGSYLDISMTDCTFAHHIIPLAQLNISGKTQPRGQDMLTGARPCYSLYETADKRYMALAALEKKFWDQACVILGRPDWQAHYYDAGRQADALKTEVAALFASQPQHYWRELFADSDCCVTAVLTPAEAFEHPQLMAREMITQLKISAQQTLRIPSPVFSFNGEKARVNNAGPAQGEHTLSVLRSLGLHETQINAWLEQGIIRQSNDSIMTDNNKEQSL